MIIYPPHRHHCRLPSDRLPLRTIFICDACGTGWHRCFSALVSWDRIRFWNWRLRREIKRAEW